MAMMNTSFGSNSNRNSCPESELSSNQEEIRPASGASVCSTPTNLSQSLPYSHCYYNNSLAIRQEIQRFESVHPSIYAIYDLLELIGGADGQLIAQRMREHVVCIEGNLHHEFDGLLLRIRILCLHQKMARFLIKITLWICYFIIIVYSILDLSNQSESSRATSLNAMHCSINVCIVFSSLALAMLDCFCYN